MIQNMMVVIYIDINKKINDKNYKYINIYL